MSSSIVYLHTRTSFKQVSDEIPITRQRNPEKHDPPDVFEGIKLCTIIALPLSNGT